MYKLVPNMIPRLTLAQGQPHTVGWIGMKSLTVSNLHTVSSESARHSRIYVSIDKEFRF